MPMHAWSLPATSPEGAGLDGLRLHDLRHNYASVAVNIGEELRTVAGLLGHSQMTTTRG